MCLLYYLWGFSWVVWHLPMWLVHLLCYKGKVTLSLEIRIWRSSHQPNVYLSLNRMENALYFYSPVNIASFFKGRVGNLFLQGPARKRFRLCSIGPTASQRCSYRAEASMGDTGVHGHAVF